MKNILYMEERRLRALRAAWLKEWKGLPDGEIKLYRNDKWWKWMRQEESRLSVIPKKDRTLAEQLAYKKYLEEKIKRVDRCIQAIRQCRMEMEWPLACEKWVREAGEEFWRLIAGYLKPNDDEGNIICGRQYAEYPEGLLIPTRAGVMVRSKSEALIADTLYENRIPFSYEEALTVGGVTLHPDFTLHIGKKKEKVRWEHMGLVDSWNYQHNMQNKLALYFDAGYIPGRNLILTFENKKYPLDARKVTWTIAELKSRYGID